MGLIDIITGLLPNKNKKDIAKLRKFLLDIKSNESKISKLTNDELRQKTNDFKLKINKANQTYISQIDKLKEDLEKKDLTIANRESIYQKIDKIEEDIYKKNQDVLSEILPEAFIVIKETAKRFVDNDKLTVTATPFDLKLAEQKDSVVIEGEKAIWHNSWDAAGKQILWDMIHYDVQLMGGVVLHEGKIAEMATGEGKTLVSTLPIYLNALTGEGVHIITVNDYLARRDSLWMGPIFEFHSLKVSCIDSTPPNSDERKMAYKADIIYGTNSEFGFDYLRDNMVNSIDEIVQRKLNYAIVDEVDSVLIDDARTPLIISGPVAKDNKENFQKLKPFVEKIVQIQKTYLNDTLLEAKKYIKDGNIKDGGFNLFRVYRGLPRNKALIKFLSQEGMRSILNKTQNFYIKDQSKEMPAIDKELYFVIDEKNNVIELTDKGVNYLSSHSNDKEFFILPDLSTEVDKIEKSQVDDREKQKQKEDLYKEFAIRSSSIHTLNQLLKAYTLFEKDVDYVSIDGQIKIVDENTGRIMEGRRYSDGLHQAIEAKENVKIESATQTFATITLQNYFKMYRKLAGMTGTAETEAAEFWNIYNLDVVVIPTNKPLVRKDYNDLIFKTAREKYNAIINKVIKISNSGRPTLVGTTSVESSELISRALKLRRIKHNVLNAKMHKKEAEIIADAGKSSAITIATNMAGRGTDIKLASESRKNGGLAIIGTERHESRRIDRQLRGRSGRQGDVGDSQFFVSLEDNLMRLFGSERIARVMDRIGLKEGETIQHYMINKSIERAQKKVEQNNFGIRKRLLEYDNVMNAQRNFIYRKRINALFGQKIGIDISNMIYDLCFYINKSTPDYNSFDYELISTFAVSTPIDKENFNKNRESNTDELYDYYYKSYKQKQNKIIDQVFPVIKNVYDSQVDKSKRIIIPFTDGVKLIQIDVNIQEAYEKKEIITKKLEQRVIINTIDDIWQRHLRGMDWLRSSVQNVVYEQKDPLVVYKLEAFDLFQESINSLNTNIISFLFKAQLPMDVMGYINREPDRIERRKQNLTTKRQFGNENQDDSSPVEPMVSEDKIGRNEKVTIRNTQTGENKTIKYKHALTLLESENQEWVMLK